MNFKIYVAASEGRRETHLEAQIMKEGILKYCGEKWDPKHKCMQKRNPQNACKAKEEEKYSKSEGSSEDDMGNQQGYNA